MTTAPLTPRTRTRPGKVMGATLLGTSIEWYDVAIYSMGAAVVIPQVFFPYLDPAPGSCPPSPRWPSRPWRDRPAHYCSGGSGTPPDGGRR